MYSSKHSFLFQHIQNGQLIIWNGQNSHNGRKQTIMREGKMNY